MLVTKKDLPDRSIIEKIKNATDAKNKISETVARFEYGEIKLDYAKVMLLGCALYLKAEHLERKFKKMDQTIEI